MMYPTGGLLLVRYADLRGDLVSTAVRRTRGRQGGHLGRRQASTLAQGQSITRVYT